MSELHENANRKVVSAEGMKKLEEKLKEMTTTGRAAIAEKLNVARGYGDLSENADYDAAREKQSEVESRIVELENMLQPGHYEIISTKKSGKKTVHIGSTVELEFLDTNEKATYTIVGSTEADPLNGKLSNETPVAQAILDAKVGQECEVEVKKPYKVLIVNIK